jgi:hypothetical protein
VLVVRFAGEPIAQAFVLRWVLEGGISTDRWSFGGFHASTVSFRGCLERVGVVRGLLFGTLLGPEATGTGRSWAGVCLFLVSCAVRVRATVNTWCGDGCDGVVV